MAWVLAGLGSALALWLLLVVLWLAVLAAGSHRALAALVLVLVLVTVLTVVLTALAQPLPA